MQKVVHILYALLSEPFRFRGHTAILPLYTCAAQELYGTWSTRFVDPNLRTLGSGQAVWIRFWVSPRFSSKIFIGTVCHMVSKIPLLGANGVRVFQCVLSLPGCCCDVWKKEWQKRTEHVVAVLGSESQARLVSKVGARTLRSWASRTLSERDLNQKLDVVMLISPRFPDIHHMITEEHNRSNSCHAGSQQRCVCISSADTWILWSFPARVGLVRTFGLEKISPKLYEQLWDCAWWDGFGTDDCSLKKRMERIIVRVMEDEENEEEREEE